MEQHQEIIKQLRAAVAKRQWVAAMRLSDELIFRIESSEQEKQLDDRGDDT